MKTKEELNALRNEVEALNTKLAELTEEELVQVAGGLAPGRRYWPYAMSVDSAEHKMPTINPDEKYVMGTFDVPDSPGPGPYEIHLYK